MSTSDRSSEPHPYGSSDEPAAAQHDLNWEIPEWSMVPLAVVVIALFAAGFGWNALLWSLVPLAVLLAAVTVIDLRELRIPNRLTGPAAIAALPLLWLSSRADWSDISVQRALLGALVLGGIYFVIAMNPFFPSGMGFGDVKLAPILGAQLAFFGWAPLVRGLFFAHLLGGLAAIAVIASRKGGLKTGFPHGPFMCAGAVVALLLEGWGVG